MKWILLLLNSAKLGKLLTTGGTMIISVFAYSFVFGWWYAAGFVLLILVHEMGHYIAARRRGLDVGAPTFIPFLGAWIELKDLPHDAETEAYVGLGGPLLGTVGALFCWWMAQIYDSKLLLALSYSGFFLNLFNLIPVSPFDGGRITGVISPRVWLIGAPILGGLFFMNPNPLLLLMAFLAAPQVLKAIRGIRGQEEEAYYTTPLDTRIRYGALYLALAGFLAIMTQAVHEQLQGPTGL